MHKEHMPCIKCIMSRSQAARAAIYRNPDQLKVYSPITLNNGNMTGSVQDVSEVKSGDPFTCNTHTWSNVLNLHKHSIQVGQGFSMHK